jgi:hypothetical protein
VTEKTLRKPETISFFLSIEGTCKKTTEKTKPENPKKQEQKKQKITRCAQ